ncbi:MAG: sigma-70 family RNA polymerase sigma factor [Clostridia bacterium]|nr:sigma-70 family RNA polymerase sigma factor [Clostridia bacterium]
MENEQLVTLIQSGNRDLLPELWEQTERLVKMLIIRYAKSKVLPNSMDIDDLLQCGYFALLQAVRAFKADNGYKFTTYLNYSVKNAIDEETGSDRKHFKEVSYNKTVRDKDGDNVELLDLMEDSTAEYDLIEPVELTDTQRTVIEALERLPPVQREVISKHYLKGLTLNQIATERHCTIENIRQYIKAGFKTLRKDRALRNLYFDTVGSSYIHRFNRFQYSPEYFETIRKIEELERNTTEYMTYGKQQARRTILLLQAQKEYDKKHI